MSDQIPNLTRAITPAAPPSFPNQIDKNPSAWASAKAFETEFLTLMLKHAGVGKPPESFSGGHGESTFRSLLLREQANAMVEAGGIGLADKIYRQISQSEQIVARK